MKIDTDEVLRNLLEMKSNYTHYYNLTIRYLTSLCARTLRDNNYDLHRSRLMLVADMIAMPVRDPVYSDLLIMIYCVVLHPLGLTMKIHPSGVFEGAYDYEIVYGFRSFYSRYHPKREDNNGKNTSLDDYLR